MTSPLTASQPEVQRRVVRVLAWQLQEQMQEQHHAKVEMARRMGTSRSQLDRLLKPDSAGVTLDTIHRAAKAVGRELRVELI